MIIENITLSGKNFYVTDQQCSHNSKMENNLPTVYIQNALPEIRTDTLFFIPSPISIYVLWVMFLILLVKCIFLELRYYRSMHYYWTGYFFEVHWIYLIINLYIVFTTIYSSPFRVGVPIYCNWKSQTS